MEEHIKVFELNNAIVSKFPVSTWESLLAVARQVWGLAVFRKVVVTLGTALVAAGLAAALAARFSRSRGQNLSALSNQVHLF